MSAFFDRAHFNTCLNLLGYIFFDIFFYLDCIIVLFLLGLFCLFEKRFLPLELISLNASSLQANDSKCACNLLLFYLVCFFYELINISTIIGAAGTIRGATGTISGRRVLDGWAQELLWSRWR
jgi:hypothetical protein